MHLAVQRLQPVVASHPVLMLARVKVAMSQRLLITLNNSSRMFLNGDSKEKVGSVEN